MLAFSEHLFLLTFSLLNFIRQNIGVSVLRLSKITFSNIPFFRFDDIRLAIFCGRNFIVIFKQFIKVGQTCYSDRFAYMRKGVVCNGKKVRRVFYPKFVYIVGHRHTEYVLEFF